jgi:hypothetical protein
MNPNSEMENGKRTGESEGARHLCRFIVRTVWCNRTRLEAWTSKRRERRAPCFSLESASEFGMKSFASLLGRLSFAASSRCRVALLAALACKLSLSAATPAVQWASVAGGPGSDLAFGIALASGREVLVVGDLDMISKNNGGSYQPQKILYRFDLNGAWIGSQASRGESIKSVAVDSQGNYYLTGRVWDSKKLGIGQNNAFYLAKYSATGTLLWERATGSPGGGFKYQENGGSKVVLDAAGYIYVTGASYGSAVFDNVTFPATPGGPLLCKYDPDGTLLWVKRVEGTSLIFENFNSGVGGKAADIALDHDGNIVITGYLNDGKADFGGTVITVDGPYDGYFFVAKFNGAGKVQWAKQSHGGYGVAVDRTGNIYCTGSAISADPDGLNGMYCAKMAPDGNPIWEKIIKGAYGQGMTLDGKDDPVFVAGLYQTLQLDNLVVPYNGIGTGSDFPEFLICKADSAGKFQWAITESGAAGARVSSVCADRSGNIFVAGWFGCAINNGWEMCGSGMLGTFSLDLLFPDGLPLGAGTVHYGDAFAARLTDPDAVAAELKVARAANGITLTWPASLTGFVLETASAVPATNWSAAPGVSSVVGDQNVVTVEIGSSPKFFRLRKP